MLFDESGEGGGPDCGVYVRPTVGGPAVRLGSGLARAISPDKKWVIALDRSYKQGITVLPTAVGESFTIHQPDFHDYLTANWLPDGRKIVFSARNRGSGLQLFIHNLASSNTRTLSSEGTMGPAAVSPDGQRIVAISVGDHSSWLFSLDSAISPKQIDGILPTEIVVQWSADARALYLRRRGGEVPLRVYRLDLETNHRQLWKEVTISDRAGVEAIGPILLTPDGRHYVVTYVRILSDLFLMSGVRE